MEAGTFLEAWRAWQGAAWREAAFARPWVLLALLALLPLLWPLFRRRAATLVHPRGALLATLPIGAGLRWLWLARVSLALALGLALVALAGPRVPGAPDPRSMEGIDLVAVLDVSGSMRAADFKPRDRLYVAKQVIHRHLLSRPRDRIGLVVFAGEAFTQAPLTHDRRLLGAILDGVRTGVIVDGTAIGDAVATGVNRLRDSKAKSRAIILVTDGDNNAGEVEPDEAASLAREMGVQIYSILVGRGGRVPFPLGGPDVLGMQNYGYADVTVNPDLLKSLATATGGAFFSAEDPSALAGSFQQILETLDRSLLEGGPVVRRPIALFPLLLWPAIVLLALAALLTLTRASSLP